MNGREGITAIALAERRRIVTGANAKSSSVAEMDRINVNPMPISHVRRMDDSSVINTGVTPLKMSSFSPTKRPSLGIDHGLSYRSMNNEE